MFLDIQKYFPSSISNQSDSTTNLSLRCERKSNNITPTDIETGTGLLYFGNCFYAYVTPFILAIGLIGNSISLKVFTSRVMRRLSFSRYLMALSGSDMLVLLTYVLLDWLNDGLKYWPGGYRWVTFSFIHNWMGDYIFKSIHFVFISVWQ